MAAGLRGNGGVPMHVPLWLEERGIPCGRCGDTRKKMEQDLRGWDDGAPEREVGDRWGGKYQGVYGDQFSGASRVSDGLEGGDLLLGFAQGFYDARLVRRNDAVVAGLGPSNSTKMVVRHKNRDFGSVS